MIRDIVKDEEFLKIPSVNASIKDKQVAVDLLDTLEHNSENCVGLAANMIGHSLNIIAVNIHQTLVIMYNPMIVEKHDPYETEEGCLSFPEIRDEVARYKNIKVKYIDTNGEEKILEANDYVAKVLQHEIDHTNGITFIDRLESYQKRRLKRELKELRNSPKHFYSV